jgi:DNA-binding transcriptional regulator PaaX
MQKKAGLITSYHKENKIYFELSDSLLEKDLLMVTRFVK